MMVVYAALFTRFFTHSHCTTTAYKGSPAHPANCLEGVVYGLQYWHAQQDVARGADKAWLYATILVGNEWPALLLALVGAVFAFLRPTTIKLFLVFMFAATLGFYCWGSERFAWLIIHPLVPMILLAGVGLQGLWELRSRFARTAAMVAVAIGAVYMVGASYSANAKQGADPRNLLVSTQSSTQVKQVADQVHALNRKAKADGRPELGITIDSAEGATFPYAWYFRDDQVGYIDMTQANYTPTTTHPDHDGGGEGRPAAEPERLPGPQLRLPGLVGEGLQEEVLRRRVVELVHEAPALEPHRRDDGVVLRAHGRRPAARQGHEVPHPEAAARLLGLQVVDLRPLGGEDDLARLAHGPELPVGRQLERADDHVADLVLRRDGSDHRRVG